MTTFSLTMTTDAIIGADFTAVTDDNLLTMFTAASNREASAAYAKAFVVHRAINVGGRKAADLIPVLKVGKSQVSNYVKQVDMVVEMGLTGKAIPAAWVNLTGSRGWFAKRSTDEYAALVKDVKATDDQDTKVALINGTPLPENAPKEQTIDDAIAMLTAARDLLATLDVKASDQAIVTTLTGEINVTVAAAAVPVLV